MKKIIPICLLFITLCFPQWAGAHAVITDYSLKIVPIHANTPGTVELSFNSHIELGLSQIFLVSKGDKHQLLTATNGTKQGQIVIQIPPLEAGDYALRFKVFAADGHLTEDVIHFSVTQ
jgi:methionine-rich copper-binding protein CopC